METEEEREHGVRPAQGRTGHQWKQDIEPSSPASGSLFSDFFQWLDKAFSSLISSSKSLVWKTYILW